MVMMIARTGRENQRYENGCRLIAGCIPYKLTEHKSDGRCVESRLQILVVKAQKSEKVLLPKGGWENDETVEEAARRETMEEAGVHGEMGNKLGVWTFGDHVAHMFPLEVSELHDTWPEKHLRERLWMSAKEARKHFKHPWMKEALDKLINILTATCEQKAQPRSTLADKRTNKVTATYEQKAQKQRQAASQCLHQNFGAIKLEIRVRFGQIVCLLFEKRTKFMWVSPRLLTLYVSCRGNGTLFRSCPGAHTPPIWRSKAKMEQQSWVLPFRAQTFVT